MGLDTTTARPWPEPEPSIGCSADCVPRGAPRNGIFCSDRSEGSGNRRAVLEGRRWREEEESEQGEFILGVFPGGRDDT